MYMRRIEVFAFSEFYNVTVNTYVRFISQTPHNRYVAGDNAPKIILFYRNGNHYYSLLWEILIKIFGHLKDLKRNILIDL